VTLRSTNVKTNQATTLIAEPTRSRVSQDAVRLVDLWCRLARRAAVADAHEHDDADNVLQLQFEVESAIRTRYPSLRPTLERLLEWEAGLIHSGSSLASPCHTCRRIELDIPQDLPFPMSVGGHR
jgi:hypothetical protein